MQRKTAVVTGASAGIGRELVRQLVRDRGMTVLATARRRDRLEALADELPTGRVVVEPGDLADPDFRPRLWRAGRGGLPRRHRPAGQQRRLRPLRRVRRRGPGRRPSDLRGQRYWPFAT